MADASDARGRVIIEAALHELVSKSANPHVPYGPEEVAADAAACAEAGATLVHFHARDSESGEQRWHDDAYIRRMARERFGWVLPGEVGYRVIDENGDTVGDTPRLDDPSAGSGTDQPDWYDQMWGSVEAAGQPLPSKEKQKPTKDKNPDAVIKQEPNRR